MLWRVFGDCKSYLLLKGHKNAVVQALWSQDDAKVVSGSSDKTLGVWDSWSGKRLLKLAEHESFVNAVSIGKQDQHMIASVGDDSVCYTWDDRSKKSSHMIQQRFPLVSVALLDERNLIFTGGEALLHATSSLCWRCAFWRRISWDVHPLKCFRQCLGLACG